MEIRNPYKDKEIITYDQLEKRKFFKKEIHEYYYFESK